RIPRIRDPASFGIQRNAGIVAFGRSNHAIEPVFADDTDPITREITRADSFGRGCSSATSPLRIHAAGNWNRKQDRQSNDWYFSHGLFLRSQALVHGFDKHLCGAKSG